jgi:hypothetical protein
MRSRGVLQPPTAAESLTELDPSSIAVADIGNPPEIGRGGLASRVGAAACRCALVMAARSLGLGTGRVEWMW